MPKSDTKPVEIDKKTEFQKMMEKLPNQHCCKFCNNASGSQHAKSMCPFNKYKALSMSYITEFPTSDWNHDVDFCSKYEALNVDSN